MKRPIGRVDEFPDREVTIREIDGRSIGIFRDGDELAAMLNVCPHRSAPVCEGLVGGTMLPSEPGTYRYGLGGYVLRCPWHGWEYDLRTGESVGPVDKRNLKMFDVTVERGDAYLELPSRD